MWYKRYRIPCDLRFFYSPHNITQKSLNKKPPQPKFSYINNHFQNTKINEQLNKLKIKKFKTAESTLPPLIFRKKIGASHNKYGIYYFPRKYVPPTTNTLFVKILSKKEGHTPPHSFFKTSYM